MSQRIKVEETTSNADGVKIKLSNGVEISLTAAWEGKVHVDFSFVEPLHVEQTAANRVGIHYQRTS